MPLSTGRNSYTLGVRSTNWETLASELFESGEIGDITDAEALAVAHELVDRDWLSRNNKRCTVTVAELSDGESQDVITAAKSGDVEAAAMIGCRESDGISLEIVAAMVARAATAIDGPRD